MDDINHRWSQVVPPHTALSFAALWDPVEGMVTFSGGQLLESDFPFTNPLRDIPRDAYDGQSTVMTLDGLSLPIFNSRLRPRVPTVTFTLNAKDDTQSTLDPFMRSTAEPQLQSQQERQPTAYLDWSQVRSVGRSIYTLARAPLDRSIFNSNKTSSHGRTRESSDDGFFEEMPLTAGTGTFSSPPVLVNLNLKSTFSMTTTSTTGYVDIDTPSVYSYTTTVRATTPSEAWSTIHGYNFQSCPNRPPDRGRRLQKPRRGLHVVIPADPAEVLARPTYNHVFAEPQSAPSAEAVRTPVARQCLRKFKSLPKLPRPSPTSSHRSPKSSWPNPETEVPQSIPPSSSLQRTSTRTANDQSYATSNTRMPPSPPMPPPSAYVPPSPTRGRPQLRRQKSIAKVVMDSVGRLTSRCRLAKAGTVGASLDS
ncbi:hypothetical protein BC835DRAFT_1415253 [Cytidiella melzeri]|nr:hypothetical protein BC835DRAFT_1415253 [Cytidiella melzeri]